MRKLSSSLLITIALVLAAPSQSALAGGKTTNKASPKLLESTAKGEHFKEVEIIARTTSNGKGLKTPTSSAITHRKAGKGQQ